MTCPARSEEKNMLSLQASYHNGIFLPVGQSTASYYFKRAQALTDVHKLLSNEGDPRNAQKVLVCVCLKCGSLTAADAVPDAVAESGPRHSFGAGYTRQVSQSPPCRQR